MFIAKEVTIPSITTSNKTASITSYAPSISGYTIVNTRVVNWGGRNPYCSISLNNNILTTDVDATLTNLKVQFLFARNRVFKIIYG